MFLQNSPNDGVKFRWVGRNRDSDPISGFIACCQCCDRPGVINMVLADCGKYLHNFFPSGPHYSSFFHTKRCGNIPTEFPLWGRQIQVGRQKSRFWSNIWLHRMLSMLWLARCYQVVTLTAGSMRRSLLMAGDDDEMSTVYDKKSQRYAKDNNCSQW